MTSDNTPGQAAPDEGAVSPRLRAAGSYTCSRGLVFSFTPDCLPAEVGHPRELIGQVVEIDGEPFTVRGVEHWAIVCPREGERCEHPFGLLVEAIQ